MLELAGCVSERFGRWWRTGREEVLVRPRALAPVAWSELIWWMAAARLVELADGFVDGAVAAVEDAADPALADVEDLPGRGDGDLCFDLIALWHVAGSCPVARAKDDGGGADEHIDRAGGLLDDGDVHDLAETTDGGRVDHGAGC